MECWQQLNRLHHSMCHIDTVFKTAVLGSQDDSGGTESWWEGFLDPKRDPHSFRDPTACFHPVLYLYGGLTAACTGGKENHKDDIVVTSKPPRSDCPDIREPVRSVSGT